MTQTRFHRSQSRRWRWPASMPALLLLFFLLVGVLMAGCTPAAPQAEKIPPATVMVATAPPPTKPSATALLPTATQVQPTSAPQATATSGQVSTAGGDGAGFQVTIVHTNDVGGETDPCG